MIVDPNSGLCECPSQQYYFTADGNPRCRQCLSKCQTCQNEYECLTYAHCTNALQWLNPATSQCQFNCTTGLVQSNCNQCNDPNCQLCDPSPTGGQRCALCQNGYFLDIATYTCVAQCSPASKAISSSNTYSLGSNVTVNYCRPFVNNTLYNYVYYINPNSTSHIELGTFEYPFKNIDTPAKEIFNFMYETQTTFTVYHLRGTSMKHYYGIMPIIILNINFYNLYNYGDPTLPKPRVYITGHDYLWPDSTLFSLAETYYNFTPRVNRGDMSRSESTTFFLKFNIFRASMLVVGLDFQSIMFGDAWSNPLVFSFDAQNKSSTFIDAYLDLDGAFHECYFPISVHVKNSHFNLTNYQYGIWTDFRWDCYANNATTLAASIIVEGTLFTDPHEQALYNFLYISTFDDFILRNNTFNNCTYLDMQTRPFLDVHPQLMCDPDFRTQHVFIDGNTFINLNGSSLMFTVNYMTNFNGTKIFSMQNNTFVNSSIKTQFMAYQIQNPSPVTVANNYYNNVTVLSGFQVFYFFSAASNITITNETLVNNVLDDLYTIGAANSIKVKDFSVTGNMGTGSITETSAILRISSATALCSIKNFSVSNSSFMYGMAMEVEQAGKLVFSDSSFSTNSLQNQDFITLNQVTQAKISNLVFNTFQKISDKSRFAISMPTLTLSPGTSSYQIANITFRNSQASFLSVSQVQVVQLQPSDPNYNWSGAFSYTIQNCSIINNTLGSKDTLFTFGEINYPNLLVTLDTVNILGNVLQLGTAYDLKLNIQAFTIKNSQILNNTGQFALLEPASSDVTNPLTLYLQNTVFAGNYARADALIQLTTNSILQASGSAFTENYSVGRGSVLFADYQAVQAKFQNCSFVRNYAYQGGVYYVQYSSQVEVNNCLVTENFGVTGGVAYVNNDGQIAINNGSRVFKNSALNTCFLFLINTQYESSIDSITVAQNDQANALINKNLFLSINGTYKHIQAPFFAAMALISDKVQRTISEQADSAVYAIKATVNFSNTDISNNDVFLSASTDSTVGIFNTTVRDINATGTIFQAVSSTIELFAVTIKRITYTLIAATQTSLQSSFYKITIVNNSFFRASNCTFDTIMGLLFYVSGSTMNLDSNTTISNAINDDANSALFAIDTSTVSIQNSNFSGIHSLYYLPIFNLQSNTLNAGQVTFTQFDKTLFALQQGSYSFSKTRISQGKMSWMPGVDPFLVNSIVFDVNMADLSLIQSDVSGIFTNYSSTVIFSQNDPTSSGANQLILKGSNFANNVANLTAGVIQAVNVNVSIDGCTFSNNAALLKDAGVMLIDCQDTAVSACQYTISNSVFKNNSANINGGAIEYTYYSPNTSINNTFLANSAIYGSTIASYALKMEIVQASSRRQLQMLTQSQVAALNLTNALVFSIATPLVSGSLMSQNVSLLLLDDRGRIMITDNSSTASMSSLSPSVTVMKSKSVQASQGVYTFNDVIIVGPPGTDILLSITSDAINMGKIMNAYPQLAGQLPNIYLKGSLRLCERGEYQTTDYKCILCSDGFFTLTSNQTQCQECPDNAVCQQGYNIILDQGYWRSSINSVDIFQCYNMDACLGGYESTCALGYGGNLCHSCVQSNTTGQWFSRQSNNDCVICLNLPTNTWRLVGVTLLVILYFMALIWINLRTSTHSNQKLSTVYMRIITNYFQILTLASSYDLSWSDNMKAFLQYIAIIASSQDILFSVDCFIRDNGITIEPVYFKMILACLLPLLCIAAVIIFWSIIGYFRRNTGAFTKLVMSIIILIFMTLPAVTTITFAIYNCIDVFSDGNTYLAIDMSLQCWTGDHEYYSNRFGIPIIVIWILGLPIIALIVLFRKRFQLSEDQNMARYGFLYTGLNHNAYYWEILLHFRKVLMICINVFLTTFKPLYRALIGFMLMIVYIEILQKVQPYQTPLINDLEFKANIAAFATFYGGLFFISSDLPISVTTLLFVLILMFNFVFWYAWFKAMFTGTFIRLRNLIVRIFCKGRFALIQQAANGEIQELQNDAQPLGEDDQSASRLPELEDPSQLIEEVPKQERKKKKGSKTASKTIDARRPKDVSQNLDDSQVKGLNGGADECRIEDDFDLRPKKKATKLLVPEKKAPAVAKVPTKTQHGKAAKKIEESPQEFSFEGSSFTNPVVESSMDVKIQPSKADGPKKNKTVKKQTTVAKKRQPQARDLSESYIEDSVSMSSSISLADDSDRPHPHSKQNPEMYRTVQQKHKTKKEPIVDQPKEKRSKSKNGHSEKKPYTQYKDSTTNEANTLSKTSTNERANGGQIIDKQSSSQPDSMLVPKERRHKSRERKSGSDNESPRQKSVSKDRKQRAEKVVPEVRRRVDHDRLSDSPFEEPQQKRSKSRHEKSQSRGEKSKSPKKHTPDLNKSRIHSDDEDDFEEAGQARVDAAKYKRQMSKKGRNEPEKRKQQKQEFDMSQQRSISPNGAQQMNRTMKEQEKLFQNSKKPMEMTVQNFGRKNPKASMPKPSRTKHMQNIEDRLYSDEELQVKHRSKTRGATAPQNERRSKTPKSRQPSVSSEEAQVARSKSRGKSSQKKEVTSPHKKKQQPPALPSSSPDDSSSARISFKGARNMRNSSSEEDPESFEIKKKERKQRFEREQPTQNVKGRSKNR